MSTAYHEVSASERAIPPEVRRAVIARDGLVCRLCRRPVREGVGRGAVDVLHVDHIHHWAAGGEHTVENLRVTCGPCNLSRGKPPYVVRSVLGPEPFTRNPTTARRRQRQLRAAGLLPSLPPARDDVALQAEIARIGRLSARQRRFLG